MEAHKPMLHTGSMCLDTFRGKTGLTLTFRPRDVYGKFHDFIRTFQKAAVFFFDLDLLTF